MTGWALRLALAGLLSAVTQPGRGAVENCLEPIKARAGQANYRVSDLDRAFPDFWEKVKKGIAVTLEHRMNVGDEQVARYGCRVTYDLWDEKVTVERLEAGRKESTATASSATSRIPEPCTDVRLKAEQGTVFTVVSVMDPVSRDQVERTRSWLAERGIGSASRELLGRAVSALIDLNVERSARRDCSVEK